MFPWQSSFKLGWCSQQLINALLTFSVMGNKLGTSHKKNYKNIFSPVHKPWHFREGRPLAHQSSLTLGDRHDYNPMMPIQVCKYSFDYAPLVALLFHSCPSLPLFLLFLSRPPRDHSAHMLQPLANNSLRSWVVYFTHSSTAMLV